MRLVPSLAHLGHTSASLRFAEGTFSNDKAPFVTFSLPHVIKFTPPSRQLTSADDQLGTIQLETHPVLDAMKGAGEKKGERNNAHSSSANAFKWHSSPDFFTLTSQKSFLWVT